MRSEEGMGGHSTGVFWRADTFGFLRGAALLGSKSPAVASRWRFVAPALLIVLILLVFMPALDAGFVGWDDDDLILLNDRYRTLDLDSLRWMCTTSLAGHFQPLTWLTYTLDWALWKDEAFGYHLTNVVLHILTALAFYAVARRLLALDAGSNSAMGSTPIMLCGAFAAALFAVHPLRAESVAWIAERRDVLSGFFYVTSVACYLRYASDRSHRQPGENGASLARSSKPIYISYIAAVTLCALSLLAKASAITLPVVLLILDVCPLRRWGRARPGPARAADGLRAASPAPAQPDHTGDRRLPGPPDRHTARLWLEKLPFFVLAGAAGARALIAQKEGGALYSFAQHDVGARLAQACHGLTFYLWKTLWPTNLGPLYEIPPRDEWSGPTLWMSLVVLLFVSFGAYRLRRRLPAIGAALAVYVVILLPVLGLAQSGPQWVADRYSYLACTGLAVLAGAGLLRALQSVSIRRDANRRAVVLFLSFMLVVGFGRATFQQADVWQSSRTLWARGVQVSPGSAIAHTNYADALAAAQRFARAAYHYNRALELNPQDAVALHHLGDLYRLAGLNDDAVRSYIRALRIDPTRLRACFSLAKLLVRKGRVCDAVKVLEDGTRRHPEAVELIDYLASLLTTYRVEIVDCGLQIADGPPNVGTP